MRSPKLEDSGHMSAPRPAAGSTTAPSAEPSDATSSARSVVAVVGVDDGGAALMSGILAHLGLRAPGPEVLRSADQRPGFGGPQWVADFHARLVKRANLQPRDARPGAFFDAGRVGMNEAHRRELTTWLAEQLAEGEAVVVKDDRLLWFLAAWRVAALRTGAELATVTVLRHPAQVVAEGHTDAAGRGGDITRLAGWLNEHLAGERATRGSRRAFVRYDDLLADWTSSVTGLGERLGIDQISLAGLNRIRDVHLFLPPTPPADPVGWDQTGVPADLRALAERAWDGLTRLAAQEGDEPAAHEQLDAVRREYAAAYADAEALAASTVSAAGPAYLRAHPPAPPPEPASVRAYRKARRTAGRAKRRIRGES
jgi:hypothetical protein